MLSCGMSYTPTAADIESYQARGYWISPKLVDDDRIDQLRRALERIFAGDFDGDGYSYRNQYPDLPLQEMFAVRKVMNGWWINDEVRDMVCDPVLGRIAAALMQADSARLWHDQVVLKPGAGTQETVLGNVGWHQDYAYWNCTTTSNMTTAWLALQDTDLNNGGMRSIVGSHKWGLVEEASTFTKQDLDGLRDRYIGRTGGEWIDEPCVLQAGQVSFHHALCFHGSGANRTTAPRLSIIGHYMPGDCGFRTNGCYHSNVGLLGPRPHDGQPYDNDYFPLVYPAPVS